MDSVAHEDVSWRLFDNEDLVFAYELAAVHGARWWNVTKNGSSPESMISLISRFAAGVTILRGQTPIGIGTLSNTGSAGTGLFDIRVVDDEHSREIVGRIVPELIQSVFAVSDIRALYHERFENDPRLLGPTEPYWRTQVIFPSYALIEGRYESLEQRVLWRDEFQEVFLPLVDAPK
jgi:hypothetical protein